MVLPTLALALTFCLTFPRDDLGRLFLEGKYEELLSLTESALSQSQSELERIDLLEYRAFSQVALGDTVDARESFQQLLILDPGHRLDPLQVSPKIREVFDRARAFLVKRGETSRLRTLEREFYAFRSEYLEKRRALRWSLLFPGLGQWKRKSPLGPPLLGIALADLIFVAVSHVRVSQTHQTYLGKRDPAEIQAAYDTYRTWYRARGYALISFAGLWTISVLEASLDF
jgi:hypothetical protein